MRAPDEEWDVANRRPPARTQRDSRSTLLIVLIVIALLLLGAIVLVLTRGDGDEPTAEPTPTATATTEPILLTGAGIGSVPLDTPGAQAALETLFGAPPTSTSPGNDDCGGPGDLLYLTWGDLRVWLSGGSLYGWGIRGNALPEGTQVATGIEIGAPYSEVAALPGAVPEYMDNFGRIVTNVDGIGYWSTEGSDVGAVTVFDIQVRPIVCG